MGNVKIKCKNTRKNQMGTYYSLKIKIRTKSGVPFF
jgi:hypothetical protein